MARRAAVNAPKIQTLDLNLLPERYRPRRLSLRRLRPWMLVAGFAVMLIPSVRILGEASASLPPLENELQQTQAGIAEFRDVSEERQALLTTYEQLTAQASQIEADYQSVSIQRVAWGPMLRGVVGLQAGEIRLTSISQSVTEVLLEGEVDAYVLPLEYADRLMATGLFETVSVESLQRLSPAQPGDTATTGPVSESSYVFRIKIMLKEPASP